MALFEVRHQSKVLVNFDPFFLVILIPIAWSGLDTSWKLQVCGNLSTVLVQRMGWNSASLVQCSASVQKLFTSTASHCSLLFHADSRFYVAEEIDDESAAYSIQGH